MRFPGPCSRLRHRLSVPVDMPDMVALEEDIAATVDLEQQAHLARPMWMLGWVRWAPELAVAAWGQPVPVLRTADKLWHLRAWKPRT